MKNVRKLLPTIRQLTQEKIRIATRVASLVAVVATITACGGASVGFSDTSGGPGGNNNGGNNNGRAGLNAFQQSVHGPILLRNQCGSCHNAQTPDVPFPHSDNNVESSYDSAITLVDQNNPAQSRLSTKIAAGHFCWTSDCNADAALMAAAINVWVNAIKSEGGNTGGGNTGGGNTGGGNTGGGNTGGGNTGGGNTGGGNTGGGNTGGGGMGANPDASVAAFSQHLHTPILRMYSCANCHFNGNPSNVPYNHSDADASVAHAAVAPFINASNPGASALVTKVEEGHFCWSGAAMCAQDAEAISAAITAWYAEIGGPAVGGTGGGDVMMFATAASKIGESKGNNRDNDGAIALYDFKEGTGTMLTDSSGVGAPLNLELQGNFEWLGDGGVQFNQDSKALASAADSKKLYDMIAGADGSGEYSVEAWVISAEPEQSGPARIATYSVNQTTRNFSVNQQVDYHYYRNRTNNPENNDNGEPALSTQNVVQVNLELTHIVATFDQVAGRKLYINGQLANVDDPLTPDALRWDENYIFGIANEVNNADRQWLGQIHLVAVYNKSLAEPQISTNFSAGVFEKFAIEFDISNLVNSPNTKIQMEASEIGGVAYSIGLPTLVTESATPLNMPIQGIRIAVNDNVPVVGQSFSELNNMLMGNGQVISPLGAVIKRVDGKETDTFKLAFEVIGNNQNVQVEAEPMPIPFVDDGMPATDLNGLRTFDQINDALSDITGVSKASPLVAATYEEIKTSFPTTPEMISFVSSHQVAMSKLSFEYCDALINDNAARSAFFGNFNFDGGVAQSLDANGVTAIVNALFEKAVGTGMDNQPGETEFKNTITTLLNEFVAADPNGNAVRTRANVIGACSAVLGSGLATIH